MRAPLVKTVLGGDPLRPQARATVTIVDDEGATTTVYAERSGDTLAATLITDVYGRLPRAFVEEGDYELNITALNGSSWQEPYQAVAASTQVLRKSTAITPAGSGSAGSGSTVAIASNTTRLSATLSNLDEEFTIWVALGDEATVGQGEPCQPKQSIPIEGYTGNVSVACESTAAYAYTQT